MSGWGNGGWWGGRKGRQGGRWEGEVAEGRGREEGVWRSLVGGEAFFQRGGNHRFDFSVRGGDEVGGCGAQRSTSVLSLC